MSTDSQMFLDRGPESFMGEIISLVRIRSLHIDIVPEFNGGERVVIEFKAIIPDREGDSPFHTINSGRSYGEALRRVREALRREIGQ